MSAGNKAQKLQSVGVKEKRVNAKASFKTNSQWIELCRICLVVACLRLLCIRVHPLYVWALEKAIEWFLLLLFVCFVHESLNAQIIDSRVIALLGIYIWLCCFCLSIFRRLFICSIRECGIDNIDFFWNLVEVHVVIYWSKMKKKNSSPTEKGNDSVWAHFHSYCVHIFSALYADWVFSSYLIHVWFFLSY